MLAYVFWHWPRAEVDRSSYEAALAAFQRSLAAVAPEGFRTAVVFRIESAPWLGSSRGGYEEWYLVEGSFVLDPLNEAAVSPAVKDLHDRAAHAAAGGAAGLYRLRAGDPAIGTARFGVWISKPERTGYEAFYSELRRWTERRSVSLWGRQLVLGPTPEFCLLSAEEQDLPSGLAERASAREIVWP